MSVRFRQEIAEVINRHSRENESNTPDFILAQYLEACLVAFETAMQQREWHKMPEILIKTTLEDPA